MSRFLLLTSNFVLLTFLAACRQDMHQAPRYDPLEESAVLPKGSAAQPIVEGTVPRGHLNDDDLMYTGKIDGKPADEFPMAITAADLDRGEQRYNIYCSPCHGRTGEGNGMVVQRGYKQAANKRSMGFAVQATAAFALWLGALGIAVWRMVH